MKDDIVLGGHGKGYEAWRVNFLKPHEIYNEGLVIMLMALLLLLLPSDKCRCQSKLSLNSRNSLISTNSIRMSMVYPKVFSIITIFIDSKSIFVFYISCANYVITNRFRFSRAILHAKVARFYWVRSLFFIFFPFQQHVPDELLMVWLLSPSTRI